MRKLKHSEAEKMLMECLGQKYPEFIKHPEIKAIVSHFLQSPQICPTFMNKEIYRKSIDLFAKYFKGLKNNCFIGYVFLISMCQHVF